MDPPRPLKDLLKQTQAALHHLWLSGHLEASRPGRPGVVAAKHMLLRRRDVAVAPIGQVKHHCLWSGTLQFDLQPSQGIGLSRRRGDGELADPDCLRDNFSLLPFVQKDRLAGVDFFLGLRQPFTHLGDNAFGPPQPLGIGSPILQGNPLFSHCQGSWLDVPHLVKRSK